MEKSWRSESVGTPNITKHRKETVFGAPKRAEISQQIRPSHFVREDEKNPCFFKRKNDWKKVESCFHCTWLNKACFFGIPYCQITEQDLKISKPNSHEKIVAKVFQMTKGFAYSFNIVLTNHIERSKFCCEKEITLEKEREILFSCFFYLKKMLTEKYNIQNVRMLYNRDFKNGKREHQHIWLVVEDVSIFDRYFETVDGYDAESQKSAFYRVAKKKLPEIPFDGDEIFCFDQSKTGFFPHLIEEQNKVVLKSIFDFSKKLDKENKAYFVFIKFVNLILENVKSQLCPMTSFAGKSQDPSMTSFAGKSQDPSMTSFAGKSQEIVFGMVSIPPRDQVPEMIIAAGKYQESCSIEKS
jgi:hypothetical protein